MDVGDTVWVMFPNVEKGLSKKLAFRMHGPYVVKKWLHGGHRVAVLAHQDLQEDTIVVHVDRMVRKQEVPKRLMEQWKPVKLVNAVPQPKRAAAEKKTLADPDLDIDHIVARAMVFREERKRVMMGGNAGCGLWDMDQLTMNGILERSFGHSWGWWASFII